MSPRVEEVEYYFPPITSGLILAFSESKEYMVGCEGDSQGSTEDWGPIVELVNDQVNPGQEFFIVHLQLVRARARFTNRMGLKISA